MCAAKNQPQDEVFQGGCSCKFAADHLRAILGKVPWLACPDLIVGNEQFDDAAVYRINQDQAFVCTVDFSSPLVSNAAQFGAIAASNALSDIYAMGGEPKVALSCLCVPDGDRRPKNSDVRDILCAAQKTCGKVHVPIAGGHTILGKELLFGLAVTGIIHPQMVKTNSGALDGDLLLLTKPLGTGLIANALRQNPCPLDEKEMAQALSDMLRWTTQINHIGHEFGKIEGVHAMTDVTGFGLVGHLLEICKASNVYAEVFIETLPLMRFTHRIADCSVQTPAAENNWRTCRDRITAQGQEVTNVVRHILADPQTNGGLLVACAPEAVEKVLDISYSGDLENAAVIGRIWKAHDGAPESIVVM